MAEKQKTHALSVDSSDNLVNLPPKASAKPLLSICIPSYKRGRHLEAQVDCILSNILSNPKYDVEVIAVNNKSPDDSEERLKRFDHPRIRVVNRDVHLDTAEENIFRSLPFAQGEYVWFLGDDDVIHLVNFESTYALLERGVHDLVIFNSALISPNGSVVCLQSMPMNGVDLESSVSQLVETIGLLFTFAGVSNVIQRTSKISVETGLEWLAISKIYSHVAWMVDCHRDSKAIFVNSPVVFYRQNDYSTGHWERVAEKQEVPNFYFWSLGLVRLLNQLVVRGALRAVQAGLIFELAGDGSRYRLLDDIIFKTYQQLELWAKTGEDRQKLTRSELAEILDFCQRCDPMLFDIVRAIERGHEALSATMTKPYGDVRAQLLDTFCREFMDLYTQRQAPGQFFTRFAGHLHGYDVYRAPKACVAIIQGEVELRERVLRSVDPMPSGVRVLVGETMEDVDAQIRAIIAARIEAEVLGAAATDTRADGGAAVATPYAEELHRMINENVALTRDLTNQLTQVYASTSWALTSPMRRVGAFFKHRLRRA